MQGEYEKAESALSYASITAANRPYALRILGRLKTDQGDVLAAQAAFDEALRLAPGDSLIWTDLARLRFISADQGGAIEAVDYALKLNPDSVRALELRGRLIRSQFGLVAALPWFERALKIDGNDVPLLVEYALTLGDAGRNRDMHKVARKIISLDSKNPQAFTEPVMLRLVDALSQSGNARAADEILAAFLVFNPSNLTALRLAGYRNLDAARWGEAIRLLERIQSRIGLNDPILLSNLARAYSGAGKDDSAVQEAATAYRIAPANIMVTHVCGKVLLKSGKRPKAAVELLQKAKILMPDNSEVAAELKRARAALQRAN